MANTSRDTTSEQELRIPSGPEPGPAGTGAPRLAPGVSPEAVAAANGMPSAPAAMRVEIERTRERMSHTLDAIEDRLVYRKREIWARATLQGLRRRIGTEPWRSLVIAFVAGYVVAAIRD